MNLDEQTIKSYKELITNPSAHGLTIDKLQDCFVECEEPTAKHILVEAYIKHINRPLPKVILYIIMDDIYGVAIHKDAAGYAGYKLSFKVPSTKTALL